MAKRAGDSMRRWALIGAEQRLLQIAQEAAAIHTQFPELRQRGGGRRAAAPRDDASDARAAKPRRRRRKMSAEARKRISDAQKARWAKQKAKKKS